MIPIATVARGGRSLVLSSAIVKPFFFRNLIFFSPSFKMLNKIDSKVSNIPEVSLLIVSTYLAIKGTAPPHLASESTTAKAHGFKDVIAKLTASAGLIPIALISSTFLQSRVLLKTKLNSDLTKKFVLSNLVLIIGSLMRLKCYSVLKEFFTFKLAVKENHKVGTKKVEGACDLHSILIYFRVLPTSKLLKPGH